MVLLMTGHAERDKNIAMSFYIERFFLFSDTASESGSGLYLLLHSALITRNEFTERVYCKRCILATCSLMAISLMNSKIFFASKEI